MFPLHPRAVSGNDKRMIKCVPPFFFLIPQELTQSNEVIWIANTSGSSDLVLSLSTLRKVHVVIEN